MQNTNSYLLRHESCPKCSTRGNDKHGDNLGVYSDGHSFCFSCGYFSSSRYPVICETHVIAEKKPQVMLPSDCNYDYPQKSLDWINKYDLDRNDLLSNHVIWSDKLERLIFPIYGDGNLLAWQGRYFGKSLGEKKWFGRGDLKNIFHMVGHKSPPLILTEDIVSAIKVSKYYQAMPLFGCHIGYKRFKRLLSLLGYKYRVLVWLDPDKRSEAILEARRGTLCGLDTSVIFSDVDPKECSYKFIKEIL